MIVFIDSNTLGAIARPDKNYDEPTNEFALCKRWLENLLRKGHRVVTSDICDYEVRRGLLGDSLRTNRIPPGIIELDNLLNEELLEFLPVSRDVLKLAADLWANATLTRQNTRDDKNIDVDIIICAQCQILEADNQGQKVIVATTNIKHISRFCEAANWQDIKF